MAEIEYTYREENDMQLEDYFEFPTPNEIRLKGHRIGIETILWDHLELGLSAEEIVLRYPTLSLEKVYATLTYYWRNQERVDAYLRSIEEEMDRLRREQDLDPFPGLKRLRELAKKREEGRKMGNPSLP